MHLLAAAQSGDWATIGGSFQRSMTEMWTKLAGFIPNLIGMLLILIIGYIVSRVLQWTATAVLKRIRFDKAAEKTGLTESMGKIGIQRTASEIVGLLVFWFFMLTFLISAADALGLDNVTKTIDSFVAYLPKVIGATVILVVGLLIAGFLRAAVRTALERVGIQYAAAASKLAYGVLLVLIGSLAFGQLQIEMTLVNRVIEIVLLAAGVALAIALGFGTRDIARHIVAGVYARESFTVGMQLRFGDDQGRVEAVTAVNTKVRTLSGETIYIPNGQLVESLVREGSDHE